MRDLPRIRWVHGPTPLVRHPWLSERFGIDLWIKRDDTTGGAEAGNKIRKLEFLLADAQSKGADTIITCGGVQSNHARATAMLAASLGMHPILFLRVTDPNAPIPSRGNVFLDRLVGADIRPITPQDYQRRWEVMETAAQEVIRQGRRAYVIPEGGSNGLGAMGYVEAMREVRNQLDLGLAGRRPFDVIVHACGSGGTAAGVALGAAKYSIAPRVVPMAVCNDSSYFHGVIAHILHEARQVAPDLPNPVGVQVRDDAKGPAYAVASPEQRQLIVDVARHTGLIFDPVYTGKALFGLQSLVRDDNLSGRRVLFLHTGGLPGLLAQSDDFAAEIG